jgi:adenosylcobinamide hydrolase
VRFNHFILPFKEPMFALSNAPHNGGLFRANSFFFVRVPKNYSGDYRKDCLEFECENGLRDFVGFMTAASIEKVLAVSRSGSVTAYVTAGITNPAIAGEVPPPWSPGTINIALVVEDDLTVGAMANAIMTATEAKTYTLMRLGYNTTGTTITAAKATKRVSGTVQGGRSAVRSTGITVTSATRTPLVGPASPSLVLSHASMTK